MSSYFTQAEKDRYTRLVERAQAEREGRPQPAPIYRNTSEDPERARND